MVFFLKNNLKSYTNYQPISVLIFSIVVYLSGITFMGVGGISTLTCQRQGMRSQTLSFPNTCTLTNTSLATPAQQKLALETLRGAALNRQRGSYQTAYQVVLLTQKGQIPLTSFSSSDRKTKLAMVDGINHFLHNPDQQTLQLQLEDSQYSSVFGFLLIATGIGSRLFAKQIIKCLCAIRNETQSGNY